MYNKKTWVSDEIITKEALNNIEEGIFNKPDFSQYLDYKLINVKEHGAVGDGVTNDAPILREIFANVEDYSVIYFPAGDYMLGNGDNSKTVLELREKKHVKIIGQSKEDTKLVTFPQTPAIPETGILYLYRTEYCSIEGLELDGNSQARHVANGGVNWGDESAPTAACDCMTIKGANHTEIRNVYAHHPMKDCLITGRYAGGNVENSHHILIEDCIFDYGYRQGMSIVGTDHGIIRNCRITNTGMAPNLFLNDGVSTIGTSPMAGIDSETWSFNSDWIIENCYFSNNRGLDINMNDGASDHVVRDNYFVGGELKGGGIVCETPSSGNRTLRNVISGNRFLNAGLGSLHGSFIITDNVFEYTTTTRINGSIVSLTTRTGTAYDKIGPSIFSNNRVIVRLDKTGIIPEMNLFCSFGANVVVTNNVFHNLYAPIIMKFDGAHNAIISNNEFTCSMDLRSVITPGTPGMPKGVVLQNNIVDEKYPLGLRKLYMGNVQSNRYCKQGDKYTGTTRIGLYTNRKYYIPVTNFANMQSLYAKLRIKSNIKLGTTGSTVLPNLIDVEYEINAYKNASGELKQKGKYNNIFDCDSHLINCGGFEVVDDIVYLTIYNEYLTQITATLEFEIIDSSDGAIDILNFADLSKYETITSALATSITAKEYVVGEQVRSHATNGSMFLYEVTTGGTVTTTQQMHYAKDYTIDGVVFKHMGYYDGQITFGQNEENN